MFPSTDQLRLLSTAALLPSAFIVQARAAQPAAGVGTGSPWEMHSSAVDTAFSF